MSFEEKVLNAICEVYRKDIPDSSLKIFSPEELEEDLRKALEREGAEDIMMYWVGAQTLYVEFSHGKNRLWVLVDICTDKVQIYRKIAEATVKRGALLK